MDAEKTKTCFKCGVEKSLKMFYAHPQMADGHLNKCKDCTKKDATVNREKNIDRVMEYDRNRPNAAERTRMNTERLKRIKESDPEKYRALEAERTRRFRGKYPEKAKAHSAVETALESGKLKKPVRCQICGYVRPLEAHHEDYSKPLEVIWLCDSCHKERHKEIRRSKRGLCKTSRAV